MALADQAHFADYWPPDFGWSKRDPFTDHTLLVDFTHSGAHFGQMHRDVVPVFRAFLDELVPLIPGGLVNGTCGCYNPGSMLPDGSRSFHTWAIAVDLNWNANPMGDGVPRPTGLHALPAVTSSIARKYGLQWGGDWNGFKDWMHVECHLSPTDAQSFTYQEDEMQAADWERLQKMFTAMPHAVWAYDQDDQKKQAWAYLQAAANPDALAKAIAAKLPAGALSKDDVSAAVRAVFADAGAP